MNPPPPRFSPDDQVRLVSDRSMVGHVQGVPTMVAGEWFYQVQFISGRVSTVPEPDLELFQPEASPEELLMAGSFGGWEDLLRLVTFRKLNVPVENTIYSLGTTRTEFYPHQYKPLLKFLDSENHRVLLADEVGLGKTIEAGLIMVELRARGALTHALVVCPKSLVYKWREEMLRRFDEEFRILSSQEFRDILVRAERDGDIRELRGIISLQSVRQAGIRELLEAAPLPLDLLIIDEAHHLRNPETHSHKAGQSLAEGASGVLLLTATPVHLGNQNLFHLLRVLDPDEFNDLGTFEDRLAANHPVVEAERIIRASFPPRMDALQERLKEMERPGRRQYFQENPYFLRIRERLNGEDELTRADVAELQQDLKDLNLLSHVFTRTRKREVFEDPPERTPFPVKASISPEEKAFYDVVTDFVRAKHAGKRGAVSTLAAITAQRQVASCMQAAKVRFSKRAVKALQTPDESDMDELDLGFQDAEDEELPLPERVLNAAAALGDLDSKFESLLEVLHRLDDAEPGRKILLFSYFKDTLGYLHRRLSEQGYRSTVIHGDIGGAGQEDEDDERAKRIKAFKHDPELRILLSSEVGSEGLDFQFCHIVINYDLPWNPMKVEQRIGRLDRLGQKSDRIVIVNLTLPDTIEDRILRRLHDRIGIFRSTIGDLEAILGDEIQKLQRDLLTQHLTPEEEERRIDRAAQVIEDRKLRLDELEREGGKFVGRDYYFEERLERARTGGEVLASDHLRAFFSRFLEKAYPDSILKEDRGGTGVFTLSIEAELDAVLRSQGDRGPAKVRLLRRMAEGKGKIRVTFSSEQAYDDPDLELLAPHHPLIQLAVEHYRGHPEELFPTVAVSLPCPEGMDPGEHLFGIYELEIDTGRVRRKLECHTLRIASGEPLGPEASSRLLGAMLRDGGRGAVEPSLVATEARRLLDLLRETALERFAQVRQNLMERNAALVQTRLVTLETSFKRQRNKFSELLNRGRRDRRTEQYLRMLEGRIRNLEADYTKRREEVEAERNVRVRSDVIGYGYAALE